MSICPFCKEPYKDTLKHAVKAHKGQKVVLSLAPLDTHYSVTIFEALDRAEAAAAKQMNDLDFATLGALIRALRQSARIEVQG